MHPHIPLSHLIEVIHEHLTHLVNWDSCIDGTVETQLPHGIRQGSQMQGIRMGEEHSINLVDIPRVGREGYNRS